MNLFFCVAVFKPLTVSHGKREEDSSSETGWLEGREKEGKEPKEK